MQDQQIDDCSKSQRQAAWTRTTLIGIVVGALGLTACSDNRAEQGLVGPDQTLTPSSSREAPSVAETPSVGEGTETEVGPGSLSLVPIVSLDQPIAFAPRPGSDHLWLAERVGRVRLVERTLDLEAATEQLRLRTKPVLDITDRITTTGEGGLLGMVFSADGNQLYVHYTDRNGDTVISEFPIGPEFGDSDAERVLLRVEQPFSNHNGGHLTFGPDGLLYIGLGDGGSADDPAGNGQNRSTLLGTILRIDPQPSTDSPYTIPATNPYAASAEDYRPEIWVWGARNPWRFSFDRDNGDLWVADVGQNEFEEINYLPNSSNGAGRGANLGWNLVEAYEPFTGDPPADHVAPLYAYSHENGRCSITGGFVYRGDNITTLEGVYLYSDYCGGGISGLWPGADGIPQVSALQLERQPNQVIGFGQATDGEIYVLEQGGQVSRIQPSDWPLQTTVMADT